MSFEKKKKTHNFCIFFPYMLNKATTNKLKHTLNKNKKK